MLGRFRDLFRRRELDAELETELAHHLDALEAEYRGRGMSEADARHAARRDMGSTARARDAFRDQHGLPAVETLWRDLRLALRSMRSAPGVHFAAIVTLAVSIGATTAIFSVVNGVLLKPLPYPDPQSLVSVVHTIPAFDPNQEIPSAPYLYFTYRDENRTLDGIGLWRLTTSSITGLGEPERVQTLLVTPEILPILAVPPMLGREFSERDATPGAPNTIILTHGYWQRRFGGDPSVVGRRLVMDGRPWEVIGVMPPTFKFLDRPADVLISFVFDRSRVTLGQYVFQSLARRKRGVDPAQAVADLTRIVPIAIDRFPPPPGFDRARFARSPVAPRLIPLKQVVVGDLGRTLWVLMGALGLVLLIACANVGNLLMVRAEGRHVEFAIRAAMGAGSRHIIRELLAESLVLGVLGGIAGVAVAAAGIRVLHSLEPMNLPRLDEIAIDPLVLLFALVVSLVAGISFGMLPAVKYARPTLAALLNGSSRSTSGSRERHRARNALAVVQVAIALVLLVCSGLMVRTFLALGRVDPGITDPQHVQMVDVSIPVTSIREPERVTRMQQDLVERIQSVTGVKSVGFSDIPPLGASTGSDTVLYVSDTSRTGPVPLRRFAFVSPGYFETLGTRLVAGRDLTWTDLYDKRTVALVSERLAREEWGSAAQALRGRVRASPADPWREVVGVVGDVHDDGMHMPAPPIVYFPTLVDRFWGTPTMVFGSTTFVIRSTRAGSADFLRDVQRAAWSVNASLPLTPVRTLEDVYRRSLARTSLTLVMLAAAALMGLFLGLVGIYAVISYIVSQRTLEIGIRTALGAQARELEWIFLRRGVVLALAGSAIGLAAAAMLTRLMSSLLFGVAALDTATYATVTVILVLIASAAAYLPARRATRINPVDALSR